MLVPDDAVGEDLIGEADDERVGPAVVDPHPVDLKTVVALRKRSMRG